MAQTSLTTNALALFTEQFKYAPNVQALATALLSSMEDVLAEQNQLFNNRSLQTAVGAQLDGLGDILGLTRQGLDDDQYRALLLFQVFVNTSKGTPEDLINAVRFLSQGTHLHYYQFCDAGFLIFTNGPNLLTTGGAPPEINLSLSEGGFLDLDSGGLLDIVPSTNIGGINIPIISTINPVGVDYISISFSLGRTPIFGFGYETESCLLLTDDGGNFEINEAGSLSYMELTISDPRPGGPDGWAGFSEVSYLQLETDTGLIISVQGNDMPSPGPLYVLNYDMSTGGGKLCEGIRDNG